MRNLELIDAVIALHEIACVVEAEIGHTALTADIRSCADRLHEVSIDQNRASNIVDEIIKQAKE